MSDLPIIDLPNQMKMVIALGDNPLEDAMTALPDESTFYILGSAADGKAQWYRVSNTVVGLAVGKITNPYLGLATVDTAAVFSLPNLPAALIRQVDRFFRVVDDERHTEAIVLLTFNPAERSPAGWGVLVPAQTNTAGHCHYDHLDAFDQLPDGHLIVGSIHSHPGMSAFASGTDHHDQTDFEGLHITFGYPRSKNFTEYHAELQLAETAWKMDHTTLIDDFDSLKGGDEVKEWSSRVKKAPATTPATTSGSGPFTNGTTKTGPGSGSTGGTGGTSSAPTAGGQKSILARLDVRENRPEKCPNPNYFTIVANIAANEKTCPVCSSQLTDAFIRNRKCGCCFTFLMVEGEDLAAVISKRKTQQMPCPEIDFDANPGSVSRPVLKYERTFVESTGAVGSAESILLFAVDGIGLPEHLSENTPPVMPTLDEDEQLIWAGGFPFG